MIFGAKTWRAAVPVLLVVLAPMVMLHTLWGNPTSAGEDDMTYYYPLRKLVGDALRQGRWPTENPYESAGMPLMGDPQAAVMYPPTWLFAVMLPKTAYSLTLFLAFSIAGGGAYLYLRRLGLISAAACFGAVAFMFCGFAVGHRVHWSILHAGAFLPWGLWCIEGLRRRPGGAFIWMVPVAWLTIAAGHWPTVIHMVLVWLVYLLLRGRPIGRAVAAAAAAACLAAVLAWPQIDMTRHVLELATRNRIGYAMAGENSFFPAAGILAAFPMLFGSRTPGFYPQPWWGPWHLCEMLGYVGLSTLVLALAGVRRMYRKPKPADSLVGTAVVAGEELAAALRPIVRAWTWLAIGATIWMLGYYLPTYRLIHMLPVLGVIRCPARMVLALDMALATLAAVTIHLLSAARPAVSPPANGDGSERGGCVSMLRRTVLRGSTLVLPLAMFSALALVAMAGAISVFFFGAQIIFFDDGGAGWEALKAVVPTNAAVWVPLVLLGLTIGAVRAWLADPGRRAPILVAVLLVDLFSVTRFVDVPASGPAGTDPQRSPAAAWLRENGPEDGSYCVWGIGTTYHGRAAELLRPKTAHALGIATINTYGPFQPPAHAHLLGFRIFGTNRDWERLIRRNDLLSLYGVRYVLVTEKAQQTVLDAVRVPSGPPAPDGPNLLPNAWWLDLASVREGVIRLRTPVLWRWSIAKQPVELTPDTIYRIALDARGPDEGAANFLRAELFQKLPDGGYVQADELGLTAYAEQIGSQWRHFEWTLRTPRELPGQCLFRVFTMSERAIEVRNLTLRASHVPQPTAVGGRLSPGERVYRRATELAPVVPGRSPVAVYENLLALPRPRYSRWSPPDQKRLERLKWQGTGPAGEGGRGGPPWIGLRIEGSPAVMLASTTLPAGILWLVFSAAILASRRIRRRSGTAEPAA